MKFQIFGWIFLLVGLVSVVDLVKGKKTGVINAWSRRRRIGTISRADDPVEFNNTVRSLMVASIILFFCAILFLFFPEQAVNRR